MCEQFGPEGPFQTLSSRFVRLLLAVRIGEQIGLSLCRTRLKQSIVDVLKASGKSSDLEFPDAKPAVLLIVGVNGGGKTTTIGKLAYKYGSEGVKVSSNLHPPSSATPTWLSIFSS